MFILKLEYSPNLSVFVWHRNFAVYCVRAGHAFGGIENGLLRVPQYLSVTIFSSPCSQQNFLVINPGYDASSITTRSPNSAMSPASELTNSFLWIIQPASSFTASAAAEP